MPQYSEIGSAMTDALRKLDPHKVNWEEVKDRGFKTLKQALMHQTVLKARDYERQCAIQCDASNLVMGVVLFQTDYET